MDLVYAAKHLSVTIPNSVVKPVHSVRVDAGRVHVNVDRPLLTYMYRSCQKALEAQQLQLELDLEESNTDKD